MTCVRYLTLNSHNENKPLIFNQQMVDFEYTISNKTYEPTNEVGIHQ